MNRMAETSIRRLVEEATETLGSDTGRLDAEVLLASILEKDRSHLHAWPGKILPQETCEQFHKLVKRRACGEPVAYLTGQREFWSLPLAVSTDTLIPRPETETLVTLALEKIPADRCLHIADLGTGSGAVALAIATERGIKNIRFMQGNWCDPLPREPFDLVLSNPPYIEEQDKHLEQGDVRFEPRSALAAGADGMDDLKRIIACAHPCLREGGWLMLEHGYNQADRVKKQLSTQGYREISSQRI